MGAEEIVTLVSIGNGAALELFENTFKDVLNNIADPNTSAKVKRSLTLTITIQPDEVRGIGFASIECNDMLLLQSPREESR